MGAVGERVVGRASWTYGTIGLMTTPEHPSPTPDPESRDRIYRSPMGIAGGLALLALALWLGIDALVLGEGRTPWLALAALILIVPAVSAFTVRPAVFANQDRLRVRNPLRVIVLPWGRVASLRSAYSNEVVTKSGTKFQLWAIPVSLRARKKANRRIDAAARGDRGRGSGSGLGGGRGDAHADGLSRAEGDKIMDELKELLARREEAESAQGEVSVRWAYEVIAPALAGALLLVILLATG
ncbi:integral membrane protein [Streptomyces zinciresistens K42]|uniref:Integral membrane protein n=2 Tax=Streptomyces TaxID=1883 RepID=G2GGD9_9ACTN|nr:integral membrane protein [Streptomyces zinciresistens K42]